MDHYLNLTIYYSKDNLTTRFSDYNNVFTLPLICALGMTFSLTSLVVAFQIKRRDHIMQYILANSLIDFLFLLTQLFLFLIRCGSLCAHGYTRAAKIYENYIYLFVGYTLNTFQALYNILMAIDRLSLFSASSCFASTLTTRRKTHWYFVLFLTLALLLNVPEYLLSRNVQAVAILISTELSSTGTSVEYLYNWITKDDWRVDHLKIFLTIFALLKSPFLYIVMGAYNILVGVKFRNFIKKKKAMSSKPSVDKPAAEIKFTITILTSFVVYLIGNFTDSMSVFLEILSPDIFNNNDFILIIGNTLFFASHAVKLFIYYILNSTFRKKFHETFLARMNLNSVSIQVVNN
jgi:hypothetical protein